MTKLNECIRCGSNPLLVYDSRDGLTYIKCSKCMYRRCLGHISEEDAVRCWNDFNSRCEGEKTKMTIKCKNCGWKPVLSTYISIDYIDASELECQHCKRMVDITINNEWQASDGSAIRPPSIGYCIECKHHKLELGIHRCKAHRDPIDGKSIKCSAIRTKLDHICDKFKKVEHKPCEEYE